MFSIPRPKSHYRTGRNAHLLKDILPIAPAKTPVSMAIDSKNHRLFVGCQNKMLAVLDTDGGKVVATLPIAATWSDDMARLTFELSIDFTPPPIDAVIVYLHIAGTTKLPPPARLH
jgi:hypothetical protein